MALPRLLRFHEGFAGCQTGTKAVDVHALKLQWAGRRPWASRRTQRLKPCLRTFKYFSNIGPATSLPQSFSGLRVARNELRLWRFGVVSCKRRNSLSAGRVTMSPPAKSCQQRSSPWPAQRRSTTKCASDNLTQSETHVPQIWP